MLSSIVLNTVSILVRSRNSGVCWNRLLILKRFITICYGYGCVIYYSCFYACCVQRIEIKYKFINVMKMEEIKLNDSISIENNTLLSFSKQLTLELLVLASNMLVLFVSTIYSFVFIFSHLILSLANRNEYFYEKAK